MQVTSDQGEGEQGLAPAEIQLAKAVELFREDQIPWDELSFRTVITTLELYFADRRKGSFGFHSQALSLPPKA